MGCFESKPEAASEPRERRQLPASHEQGGQHQHGAGDRSGAAAPVSIGGSSSARPAQPVLGAGAELLSTSTEQRIREQEFYNRIVTRTNANFINVSTATYSLDGQDPYEFSAEYRACVEAADLDQEAVRLFAFPKAGCATADEAAAVLSAPLLAEDAEQQFLAWTDAIVQAGNNMRIHDGGQPLVVTA